MATIKNDRDVLLQAATTRYFVNGLASGMSIFRPLTDNSWSSNVPQVAVSDAPAGPTVRRSVAGVDTVFNQTTMFQIDRSRTYRARFWARASATANGVLYHTLRQFLADGSPGPNNGGRSPYKPSNIAPASALVWTEYSFTWSAADWQVGVTQVRPDFLLNYGGNTGYWEVQDFKMWDATEAVNAQLAADAAAEAAADAQVDATAANTAIANIFADNVLSRDEKTEVVRRITEANAEYTPITSQAIALAVSHSTFTTTNNALNAYLASLSPAYNDLTQNTTIVRADANAAWNNYYAAKVALLNTIAAKAATLADWANIAAQPNAPASNATVGTTLNDDPQGLNASSWAIPSGVILATGTGAAGAVCSNYFSATMPASGVDRVLFSARAFPINPARTYDLTANLYAGAGNDRNMYVVVNFYDADGVAIAQNGWGGSYSGYTFGGNPPTGTFTRLGGWFGPGYPSRPIPSNARTAKIGAWFQYNNGSSNAEQAAQDIRLSDVTEAANAQISANAAQTSANNAAASAALANAEIANIASDNVLSRAEKSNVTLIEAEIGGEFNDIIAKADATGVSRVAYYNSRVAMNSYLAGLSPSWSDLTTNTAIVGTTFRAIYSDYYTTRQLLLNAIAADAAARANTAQAAANAAQTAANNAATQAALANAELANVISDNVLSKGEKPAEILRYTGFIDEHPPLYTKATDFAVITERDTYYSTIVALAAYVTGLSTFYDTTVNTSIVGTTYRSTFNDVYVTKQALLNAIAAKAKVLADSAQGTANTAVTNAATAQAAANAAQADATAANTAIANIFADNVLSRDEKTEVVRRITEANAEYTPITSQAIALAVSHSTFTTTNNALNAYLASLSPAYNDLTQNTTIVRADANAAWNNYYAAKVALLNTIAAKAATTANQDSVITTPGGGFRLSQTAAEAGAIKIALPVSWTDTMMKFTVDIFEYAVGLSCTLEIAGYNYTGASSWYNVTARVVGGSNVEYPVRFGHDGTKCCVWIGNPATESWAYPQIRVRDVFLGYSNVTAASWGNGWAISISTAALTNVTAEVLDTYPAADWTKVIGTGRPANNATVGAPAGTNVAGVDAGTVATGASNGTTALNTLNNALVATITDNFISSRSNTTSHVSLGSATVNISGGTSPYFVSWAITNIGSDPEPRDITLTVTGESTATLSPKATVPSNTRVMAGVGCTITDSGTPSRVKYLTEFISCQFGTPV